MCKVSDKIKFCTCGTKQVWKLKHYWVLYRYKRGQSPFIGEPVMPAWIDEDLDNLNISTLIKRLNEADAFDTDIAPKERDKLEIHFTTPRLQPGHISYFFQYRRGKWKEGGEIANYCPTDERNPAGKLISALDNTYKRPCEGNRQRY